MGNNHSQGNEVDLTRPVLQRRPNSDSQMITDAPQQRIQHKPLVRRTSSSIGYHPRSASLRRMRSIHRRRIIEDTNSPNKTRSPAKRTTKMEAENKKIQEKKHLLAACARGDISKVEMLVDNGVDVNSADKDQMTALHYASMHARDEVIQSLISRGAEVNTQDLKGGFTALHWVVINAEPQYSAINHQEKSLTTLFRAGAKVDAPDFNLATPLHTAAQKGNQGAVQALMRLGANPDALDITGRNCFEVARSEKVKTLLKKLHDNSKKIPIYQVLEAPPPSFPAPLPPVIPPPRLVTAAKANSDDHIYNIPEFTPSPSPPPSPSERSTSVTPPPPPPHKRRQYVEYSKNNHIYHILEVSSSKHRVQRHPTPPRRRKARKQI